MKRELISIIIPTYNRSKFIKNAVHSVLNQTYKDIEIIIVDDCSTDATESIIAFIGDERLKYIKNSKNTGVAFSRNIGIKNSKGSYISFIDDDDEWMPEKLEKQISRFKELTDDYGVVYCGYGIYNKSGVLNGEKHPEFKGSVAKKMLAGSIMGGSTPLLRKRVFDVCGLHDTSLKNAVDWEMWIRVSQSFKFDFVDEVLVKYNIHGNQLSVDIKNKIRALNIIKEKHKYIIKQNNEEFSMLKKLFKLNLAIKQNKHAYYLLKKAYRINRKDINTILQIFMIITAPELIRYIIYQKSFYRSGKITLY